MSKPVFQKSVFHDRIDVRPSKRMGSTSERLYPVQKRHEETSDSVAWTQCSLDHYSILWPFYGSRTWQFSTILDKCCFTFNFPFVDPHTDIFGLLFFIFRLSATNTWPIANLLFFWERCLFSGRTGTHATMDIIWRVLRHIGAKKKISGEQKMLWELELL